MLASVLRSETILKGQIRPLLVTVLMLVEVTGVLGWKTVKHSMHLEGG